MGTFKALPPAIDLPATEKDILAFWEKNSIFAKSVAAREGAQGWTFYEGPPTANGKPGTHHIEARVFKDLFPRFQTMKGKHVLRKAGWDCHGLPVEIAVEKELGFTGKGDIEKFGIAAFNEKCRESVQRHVGEFSEMTRRMGFWVDFDEAYWTMSPEYVESVWWSLQQIFKKGLLVQDHRVAPYCPRCGTGLSDHELAQGYETVQDPSVYVRFEATSGIAAEHGAAFLVWTTTPWTLVSNTAIAVNPAVMYQIIEVARENGSERLVVAENLVSKIAKSEDISVLATVIGSDLERSAYTRPFDLLDIPDSHFIVLADYVTVEDGTGLVHQAPAFGADDLRVCRSYGLPVVNPIAADGTFLPEIDLVGGAFFKDADKVLIKDLKARGLIFKHTQYEHSYPHCWRCHTVLIYYAQPSWYIRTTAIKESLLRENEKTDWHPGTIKNGRYGDWLTNNIDWAVSRNRYWGTPLPIWRCPDGHLYCVGSLAELAQLSGQSVSATDPHRPFVDEITFDCHECSGTMTRVSEVIDCWYDSGAMPFAQWGYPHKEGSVEKFKAAYPANFIAEAIDQTRGWFYTLMTIGTLVFDQSSYETVLCLGHILDKDGRKMSKHLGNVLEPIALMDQHGADAVRWYMLAAGSPWSSRRVGHDALSDVVRKTLLTYWNTVSFFTLYAHAANFTITDQSTPPSEVPAKTTPQVMDRWIRSELNQLIKSVDQAYSEFDSQQAGKLLAAFIDDLSNWYVRRSRRRFWDGDSAALSTLHEALKILTQLLAPMIPFISEHVWQELVRVADPTAPESVHLTDFPIADEKLIDNQLTHSVRLSRRLVELGRAARAESKIKIRQPLGRALVAALGFDAMDPEIRAHIAEELNVLDLAGLAQADGDLVDVSIKANFRTIGARFGGDVQAIAQTLLATNHMETVRTIRSAGSITISYEGKSAQLELDDLVITETPKSGWSVASHSGESVALDLQLTPFLIQAGLVREIIRAIQEERKSSDFDISDRISVRWNGTPELITALNAEEKFIAAEVLATSFTYDPTLEISKSEIGFALALSKS